MKLWTRSEMHGVESDRNRNAGPLHVYRCEETMQKCMEQFGASRFICMVVVCAVYCKL